MIARTPADLGRLIRSRRRELGLDQASLATRVGVSRLWIVEFERGKPRAEVGLVLRTLTALGLHVDVTTARPQTSIAASETSVVTPDLDAIVRAAKKPATRVGKAPPPKRRKAR